MTTYSYPISGQYNETVATLDDGREITIDTQAGICRPWPHAHKGCSMLTTIGGACDCGALHGVDVDALVADARINGLRGRPPKATPTAEQLAEALDAELVYEARRDRIRKAMEE